jgi:hypothetical protein
VAAREDARGADVETLRRQSAAALAAARASAASSVPPAELVEARGASVGAGSSDPRTPSRAHAQLISSSRRGSCVRKKRATPRRTCTPPSFDDNAPPPPPSPGDEDDDGVAEGTRSERLVCGSGLSLIHFYSTDVARPRTRYSALSPPQPTCTLAGGSGLSQNALRQWPPGTQRYATGLDSSMNL